MLDVVLGNNSFIAASPVRFAKPIYGKLNPTFTDFVAPGIMVSVESQGGGKGFQLEKENEKECVNVMIQWRITHTHTHTHTHTQMHTRSRHLSSVRR